MWQAACRCRAMVALWTAALAFFATAAGAAEDREATARELFSRMDLSHPSVQGVGDLVAAGRHVEALELWRDRVVLRFRARDFGEYGWHDYVLHPRPAGAVDYLAGKRTRDDYLSSGLLGFVDIYGMAGPPGAVDRINWFVDINGPIEWGSEELAAKDINAKLQQTDYPNFEFAKPFVGRYWQTGDVDYLLKAFEIMADFSRHSHDDFWSDYQERPIDDRLVREVYRCDWRLNTNGLEMGWRLKNFIKIIAGLCKSLSGDKPSAWGDILKPVSGTPTREELDRIPAHLLADIAISMLEQHTPKLLWFCIPDGAVPNQRAEGLKAMAFAAALFPEFTCAPQLADYVRRGYEDMLTGNFLPDGGSLEQSFNYNSQDKEGLEELVRFFGDDPPPYAQLALEKVRARRLVDDGLQDPLGGLPQVGNSHAVRGKDVWSSPEPAQRYLDATDIDGKQPIRPQSYTSTAFAFSGFFAMRSGWGLRDLYLFMMAGRPQRGHSMRDTNSIQMTAYGRQLVVCGGPPTYGMFRSEEARGADFYLSEQSSLKTNTVIVDGRSQAHSADRPFRAFDTPVPARWHSSERYDLVDNLYALGYCDHENGRDVNTDMSVSHNRTVIFVKAARLWLVEDRMINTGDAEHEYSQLWNFPPVYEDQSWARTIAGFAEDEFALEPAQRRFRTADPYGPNVELLQFGPESIRYDKYYGDRQRWLGWFAKGIGDAQPAVDIHASWQSADSDRLITLMAPVDVGRASPVAAASSPPRSDGASRRVDVELADGGRLSYVSNQEAAEARIGSVAATAGAVLIHTDAEMLTSGIVMGCTAFAVDGNGIEPPAEDFEFVVGAGGRVDATPFHIARVPAISQPLPFAQIADAPPVTIAGADEHSEVRYTLDGAAPAPASPVYRDPIRLSQPATVKARFIVDGHPLPVMAVRDYQPCEWRLRKPDLPADAELSHGLSWAAYQFEGGYIRLYDLMLREPVDSGRCMDLSLDRWAEQRSYGVRWEGYLRVPRDGIYHFHCHAPSGAYLFFYNPQVDLRVPAVVAPTYLTRQATGSTALQAGLHQMQLEYVRFPGNPGELLVEVEGPGTPRQPLPAEWLFRREEP